MNFNDPDEPMMEGSDEEFSELEKKDDEEDSDDEDPLCLCFSISSVLSSPGTASLAEGRKKEEEQFGSLATVWFYTLPKLYSNFAGRFGYRNPRK